MLKLPLCSHVNIYTRRNDSVLLSSSLQLLLFLMSVANYGLLVNISQGKGLCQIFDGKADRQIMLTFNN